MIIETIIFLLILNCSPTTITQYINDVNLQYAAHMNAISQMLPFEVMTYFLYLNINISMITCARIFDRIIYSLFIRAICWNVGIDLQ